MVRIAVTLLKVLTILAVIASSANLPALAQDITPPAPGPAPHHINKLNDPDRPGRPGPRPERGGNLPVKAAPSPGAPVLSHQSAGGPDDYGYTWDDSVPFNWIDATRGTDVGLRSDNGFTTAIDIGFDFKFYENTYSQIYISTNGLITFGEGTYHFSPDNIPNPATPNNFIAPYWSDLCFDCYGDPSGAVYTLQGGEAPNRYFVVEWHNIYDLWSDAIPITFEAILFENGDILFQYLKLPEYFYYNFKIGIEDGDGIVGLEYILTDESLVDNLGIRFSRPDPSARIKMWPIQQGSFTHAGETVTFQTAIYNTGELGADVYDLYVTSSWPVSLYAADGATPLADTDGDGTVDTGPILQGANSTVTVKISTPDWVMVGDHHTAQILVRSSADIARQKIAYLSTAIPAPFAQAFGGDEDGAMNLLLAQPADQILKKVTPDWTYGYDVAVVETPNGFAYFWNWSRSTYDALTSEIQYVLVDHFGQTSRGVGILSTFSETNGSLYEGELAAAVAPDGRIGVVWSRSLYDWDNNLENSNIYYAVLDSSGRIIVPPTSLTNNSLWGDWDSLNVPSFSDPRIAATEDNRFTIAWIQTHNGGSSGNCYGYCSVSDIYYTIHNTDGGAIKPVTRFTADTPGWDQGYDYLNLAPLSGNRMLFVYYQESDDHIHYTVIDSAGNTVKSPTSTGSVGWEPDAVQLSNGNILIAWNSWETQFAVLDSAYNIISGPNTLSNLQTSTGNGYVSVAADQDGHAILTWMDQDWSSPNLYYALVNSNGNVLTPPMIFHRVKGAGSSAYTSLEGYGNTSYRWTPPAEVDGVVDFRSSFAAGQPGSATGIHVKIANHGLATATGLVLTAVLEDGLTYVGDTTGVVPTVNGNEIIWELPDLGFLDVQEFSIFVRLPADANYGDQYSVTLNLATDGQDANAEDNTGAIEVMAARQVFLPLSTKEH